MEYKYTKLSSPR